MKKSRFLLGTVVLVVSGLLLGVTGMRLARAAAGTTLYVPLAMGGSRAFPLAFPDPAGFIWSVDAQGISSGTGLVAARDGSGRLFVLERAGRIRILSGGTLQSAPFLDILARVGSAGGEQGLLGLAFDPNYATNGRFYVDYTDKNGDTVISRFTRSAANPDLADSASEVVVLTQPQPASNHNGGDLAFGPDGFLYIAFGDGGGAGDPNNNGQNMNTFLGKILRINVSSLPYSIPPGNPYIQAAGKKAEIWASGLRNPWRFSFDRQTGDFYIADVGQNAWEEVDFQPAGSSGAAAGRNYGWRYREGRHPYQGTPPANLALTDPVFEYNHANGCAITGGYVYRGSDLPEWRGIYLFADYCSGQVWGLRQQGGFWEGRVLFSTNQMVTAFGQDEAGELYLLTSAGQVLRFSRR